MTRKEALDILMSANVWNDEERTAWEVLVPELAESEDERIRRKMIEHFKAKTKETWCNMPVKDIIAYLEKQKEQKKKNVLIWGDTQVTIDVQKPMEWSREDQKSLNRAINICISDFGEDCETARFLKSLPKRFNLQPKQEWSDEDERVLKGIIGLVDHDQHYGVSNKEMISWLKSLRPSWKPSEHQMNILKAVKEYVGKGSGYWGEGLGSLIEDLEKL